MHSIEYTERIARKQTNKQVEIIMMDLPPEFSNEFDHKNFSRGARLDREAAARASIKQTASIVTKGSLAPQRDLKQVLASHEATLKAGGKSRLAGKIVKLQQAAEKAAKNAKNREKLAVSITLTRQEKHERRNGMH